MSSRVDSVLLRELFVRACPGVWTNTSQGCVVLLQLLKELEVCTTAGWSIDSEESACLTISLLKPGSGGACLQSQTETGGSL